MMYHNNKKNMCCIHQQIRKAKEKRKDKQKQPNRRRGKSILAPFNTGEKCPLGKKKKKKKGAEKMNIICTGCPAWKVSKLPSNHIPLTAAVVHPAGRSMTPAKATKPESQDLTLLLRRQPGFRAGAVPPARVSSFSLAVGWAHPPSCVPLA
jgi:hypothetical protein